MNSNNDTLLVKGIGTGVILLISALFFFLLFQGNGTIVRAEAGDNVFGYAWSSNIGWISMNSSNCDPDNDGLVGTPGPAELSSCPPWGSPMAFYGVSVDPDTGYFSGYAWSDNIGWIDFAPVSGYPEAPNQGAQLVGTNVVGWAKALSAEDAEAGGWDGWIKLSGSWANGVTITNGNFDGYAWGSDVVGWIDFDQVTLEEEGTLTLSADPVLIASGTPVTIEWTTTDMDSCTASDDWSGSKSVNGTYTQVVNPTSDAVYTLDCVDDLGNSHSDSVVIQVVSGGSVILTADKRIVRQGEDVVLSWDTGGIPIGNCTFTGPQVTPIASTTGSQTITMNSTNTFTLDCVAADASVTVSVVPAIEEN